VKKTLGPIGIYAPVVPKILPNVTDHIKTVQNLVIMIPNKSDECESETRKHKQVIAKNIYSPG